MRIAVTGATGFVGHHVLRALLAHGYEELIVVGRQSPPRDARITFVETDLLADNATEWLSMYRPSHLLHLAWYTEHAQFWESPVNRDWRDATVSLARSFCEQGGQRLIMAGSCAEYDWSGDDWCRVGETPLRPLTRYGEEKNRTRELTAAICQASGVRLTWGRIFYPFGPGEAHVRLIPSVVDALSGQRPPFSINVGHWRDLMPVEDAAEAFVHMLSRDDLGITNVCSGVPIKIADMVERIAEAIGCDPRPLLTLGIENGAGPAFLAGDNELLLETGWRPRYDPVNRLQSYARLLAQDSPDNRNFAGNS